MSEQPEITVMVASGSAPAVEPAVVAEPPGQTPRRRPSWLVVGLAVWAGIATIAAVVLGTWWAPLHNDARDRRQVEALAGEFALHLTTFRGEAIDDWVAETQGWATGNYAEQLNRLFDAELRDALGDAQVTSEGALLNLFVQDASGDEATVFAVVRQTIDNRFGRPFEDELRMEITMQRERGDWLVSDVAVLGPGGLGLPGAQGEEGP